MRGLRDLTKLMKFVLLRLTLHVENLSTLFYISVCVFVFFVTYTYIGRKDNKNTIFD